MVKERRRILATSSSWCGHKGDAIAVVGFTPEFTSAGRVVKARARRGGAFLWLLVRKLGERDLEQSGVVKKRQKQQIITGQMWY